MPINDWRIWKRAQSSSYVANDPKDWPAHAKFGASNAERWLNCPGSYSLCQTVPEGPSSKYAQEGSDAHKVAEDILRSGSDGSFERTVYDPEMVDYVMAYVKVCRDELKDFDTGSLASNFRVEQRLVLDYGLGMFGTADFLATGTKGVAHAGLVVDLKYGKGKKVKAEGNPQLAYYAVALAAQSRLDLKSVKVVVVQPRIDNGVTSVSYSERQLNDWHQLLIRGAEEALWQSALGQEKYVPGEWCWFCPAKGVCPARVRKEFGVENEKENDEQGMVRVQISKRRST